MNKLKNLNISKNLVLITLYTIIGIVFTFPLVKSISTHIPNNLYAGAEHTYEWGDHLQVFAGFREHKNLLENVFTGKPLYTKEFCYGELESCTFELISIAKYIVFSAYWPHTILNTVFDDPVVYNLVILFSFAAVGVPAYYLSEYILVKRFRRNSNSKLVKTIAFVSSLFIVIAPIRLHHLLVGHRNGYLVAVLVYIIYMLEKFFDSKKLGQIFLVSLGLFYLSFNEQFFTYFGIMYFAIRIIFNEIFVKKMKIKSLKDFAIWISSQIQKYWILLFSVFGAGYVNYVTKIQEIAKSNISDGRPFSLIEYYSPPSLEYLLNSNILEHEHNVYIGIVGIVILILGLLVFLSKRFKKSKFERSNYIFWIVVTFFFLIISLGASTPIYKVLYDYLPTFNFSRTPVRAVFFVFPLLGILLTYISIFLLKFKKEFNGLIFWGISGILILISLRVSTEVQMVGIPKALDIPSEEKILFVPITEAGNFFSSIYEFEISQNNAVTINGYHPYTMDFVADFEGEWAAEINQAAIDGKDIMAEFPDLLEDLKVDKVIILDEYLLNERVGVYK